MLCFEVRERSVSSYGLCQGPSAAGQLLSPVLQKHSFAAYPEPANQVMGPPDSQSGKNHVAQKVTALRHAHGAHHRAENESGPQPLTLVAPACQHAPGYDAKGAGGMAADKGAVVSQ